MKSTVLNSSLFRFLERLNINDYLRCLESIAYESNLPLTASNSVFMNSVLMNAKQVDWRKDLEESRDLNGHEKKTFGYLLSRFETWRLKAELPLERSSAVVFWKKEVIREDRPREKWQLDQWGDAVGQD